MRLDPRVARLRGWLGRHRTKLSLAMTALVLVLAGLALKTILADLDWAEVTAAFAAITAHQIALSLGLTALSYLVLTGYDVLALNAMGKPQRYWRAALGSFTAYTFSHNLGFAPITGAAARWRAYRGTNLNAADIARIVVIAGVTFWLGIFLLLGVFLILFPGALRIEDRVLPHATQAAIGVVVLAGILAYLVACARQTGPLSILGWRLPVPTLRQAFLQFALAATDIAIASAALLVLLPPESWHHYPDFLVAYVVAMVVALITHAPGGLGVFEAVILVTLPEVDRPALVSALILYRIIYYWLPFALALLLLGANELRMIARRRDPVQPADRPQPLSKKLTL
ncbi:MAG: lysylphosphatidylglycerol synthase domain-containing protein [Sphingomonadaceae bacterium]